MSLIFFFLVVHTDRYFEANDIIIYTAIMFVPGPYSSPFLYQLKLSVHAWECFQSTQIYHREKNKPCVKNSQPKTTANERKNMFHAMSEFVRNFMCYH